MNYFYVVTRIFFKGENETHSVQLIEDRLQATQRFYNIIAADLADKDITYQYATLTDSYGNKVLDPVIYDRTPAPNEE